MKQFILIFILGFSRTIWSQTTLEGDWLMDANKKITFNTDGTFHYVQGDKKYLGKFSIQNDALILIYPNGTKTYKIISSTKNQMTIGNESNSSTLILKKEMPKESLPNLLPPPAQNQEIMIAEEISTIEKTSTKEKEEDVTKETVAISYDKEGKSHQRHGTIKLQIPTMSIECE